MLNYSVHEVLAATHGCYVRLLCVTRVMTVDDSDTFLLMSVVFVFSINTFEIDLLFTWRRFNESVCLAHLADDILLERLIALRHAMWRRSCSPLHDTRYDTH